MNVEENIELKLRNNIGITIVSLVITIIVLLMLAGVALNFALGEDGIFRKAKKATEIYQNAQIAEEKELENISKYINEYLNGSIDGEDEEEVKLSDVEKAIEDGTIFKENTILKDKFDNEIKIPKDFKLAIDSGKTVIDGIVIEDVNAGDCKSIGNQYVWIPIGDINVNENKDVETIEFGRYSFDEITGKEKLEQSADRYTEEIAIQDRYYEYITSKYDNVVAKDLAGFITKAKSSKGFYIGRYEVGDEEAVEARNFTDDEPYISQTPVVKKEKWPYTCISQPQAANLARSMYANNDNIVSDLINSYALDTTMVFIQRFSGDSDYSQQLGENTKSELNKTGESILKSDNKLDMRCNIYDMAGNTYEWTTESSAHISAHCVSRGGICKLKGDLEFSAADRHIYNADGFDGNLDSFRTILYL